MYKVIIIDDNELTRKSIAKTIDKQIPQCTVVDDASDGKEGLLKILSVMPDIIISDIRMPNLDGLSMVRIVQTSFPATQVIFITGYQDFENAHAAIQLHACAFLLKPIHSNKLIEALQLAITNIQKNSPSLLQELQSLKQILEESEEEHLHNILLRILRQVHFQSNNDPSFVLSGIQQICAFMLHYYWNLAPQKIDLEQETAALYELKNVPQNETDQLTFLISYKDRLRLFTGKEKNNRSLMISHVLQYIQDNFKQDLSLNDTALFFSVNASYLSSRIKKETGKSFTELITEKRLRYAKELLRNPRIRINEVSEQSGFKDYVYFYQAFKKQEGISPKEYRNHFL